MRGHQEKRREHSHCRRWNHAVLAEVGQKLGLGILGAEAVMVRWAEKKAESELMPWEPTSEVLQGLGDSFQPFAKVLIRHRLIYRRKEEGPDKGFDHLKGRFDILYSPHWLDIAVSREFHNRASSADAGGILFSQS